MGKTDIAINAVDYDLSDDYDFLPQIIFVMSHPPKADETSHSNNLIWFSWGCLWIDVSSNPVMDIRATQTPSLYCFNTANMSSSDLIFFILALIKIENLII